MKEILLFFLIALIQLIKTQVNEINLNEETEGETFNKNSNFYYLDLKKIKLNSQQFLIIDARPLDELENFCDPDLYISTTNSNPSEYSNEYSSNALGEDIISIPISEIKDKDKLYIAIKTIQSCKYKLSIKSESEITINFLEEYTINFDGNSTNKQFRLNVDQNSSFRINSYSFNGGIYMMKVQLISKYSYLIFIDDRNKSVLKEFNSNPDFFNGFSVNVNMKDENSCSNCFIRIIFHSTNFSKVNFIAKLNGIDTRLKHYVLDSLEINEKACYSYFYPKDFSDNMILFLVNVFHGELTLEVKANSTTTLEPLKFEGINQEKSFIIQEPLKYGNSLIICAVTTDRRTSFGLRVILEDEEEKQQRFNILINGYPTLGYLPKQKATHYVTYNQGHYSNRIHLNMKIIKGDPILYGYICQDIKDCYFDKNKIFEQCIN